MKIEPDGKQVGIYGGDGGYSAVDPDNSNVAYEEYTRRHPRDHRRRQDAGATSRRPTTRYQFINPFVMDPTDAKHLLTGGHGASYETHHRAAAARLDEGLRPRHAQPGARAATEVGDGRPARRSPMRGHRAAAGRARRPPDFD